MVHRITGAHLFGIESGAALWGSWSAVELESLLAKVQRGASQLGFFVRPFVHQHQKGQAIVCPFPTDLLYTACDLLEWAVGDIPEFETVLQQYHTEENLLWRELKRSAMDRGIPVLDDEDGLTLGLASSQSI